MRRTTTGADVSTNPDILDGVCRAFTYDLDSELVWVLEIHDPATGCLEGFAFEGHEVTIANLRDGLLWSVAGYEEGNVIQLDGTVASEIFTIDGASVRAGTPIRDLLIAADPIARGPVSANVNIVGTQAEGDGIDVAELTLRGRGTVIMADGSEAEFTAGIHEEISTIANGLSPTRIMGRLDLRERRSRPSG